MAKFAAGDKVLVGFNPLAPDLRVPNQANGTAVGRGSYQTKPDKGTVIQVLQDMAESSYLVDVELHVEHTRNGKPFDVVSTRKRVIAESKLEAV